MVAPQQKLTHGVGKHTAPADSPRISVCSFLWTFTGEKVPSTECLNSCILYPSITVLILFKEPPPHFISAECSQQNMFVCFQILEELVCLRHYVFKAGNSLGVHKCCIYWVAKENGGKKTTKPKKTHKTNFKKKSQFAKQGLAAPFHQCVCICSARGGEFCFFPFLRLGCSGHQGLTLANPDEVCCFCLYDITPTWRLQLLLSEIRFCFFWN